MSPILALALKDLKLMPRNRAGLFFTFIWPVVVTVLFGFAFGGGQAADQQKPHVALVDEDGTGGSRGFAEALAGAFEVTPMPRAEAEGAVRRGRLTAYIALKAGFGAASERMFYGEPRTIELGIDPARKAEAGMIEGLLMKQAAADMQALFSNPSRSASMVDKALQDMPAHPGPDLAPVEKFLGELKAFIKTPQAQSGAGGPSTWQPLVVDVTEVAREGRGPDSAFAVTFPQGVIWGLIGCVMTFGISLVVERTHGTLVRLRMAPLTRAEILGGKALACFTTIVAVELTLYGVAAALGVKPSSLPLLALAGLSAAVCFVGFMMLIASLGRTEQSASGAAWAILMPLAMFGGAMVPQFILPPWMQAIGVISPIRWAVLAIEGAVWRRFTLAEMAVPCLVLVTVGVACFLVGARALKEA